MNGWGRAGVHGNILRKKFIEPRQWFFIVSYHDQIDYTIYI